MAIIENTFTQLVRSKLIAKWEADLGNPTSAQSNLYFSNLVSAISGGIVQSLNESTFTTIDTGFRADPLIEGEGTGVGLTIQTTPSLPLMYTKVRDKCQELAQLYNRDTGHEPWPTTRFNYMEKICESIIEALGERLPLDYNLESIHPEIYAGSGIINSFTNITVSKINGYMEDRNVVLAGIGWPYVRQGFAQGFYDVLQAYISGSVTIEGECEADVNQFCEIDDTGSGTGILI